MDALICPPRETKRVALFGLTNQGMCSSSDTAVRLVVWAFCCLLRRGHSPCKVVPDSWRRAQPREDRGQSSVREASSSCAREGPTPSPLAFLISPSQQSELYSLRTPRPLLVPSRSLVYSGLGEVLADYKVHFSLINSRAYILYREQRVDQCRAPYDWESFGTFTRI